MIIIFFVNTESQHVAEVADVRLGRLHKRNKSMNHPALTRTIRTRTTASVMQDLLRSIEHDPRTIQDRYLAHLSLNDYPANPATTKDS
jgi:hypothetical protein